MPAIVRAMHELVDSAHNLFIWTDAQGRPVDRFCEAYFSAVVTADAQNLPGKTDLAAIAMHGKPAGNMRQRPSDFYHSPFFAEVYRPMRVQHSLDAVVRVSGQPMGVLVLHRDSDMPFSETEQNDLEAVLPYLRNLWAQRPVHSVDAFIESDHADQGAAIIAPGGQIQYLSASAEQLLRMADVRSAFRAPAGMVQLPEPVARLCARFAQSEPAAIHQMPHSHSIVNAWGRFVFSVFWLEGRAAHESGLIGLTIQRQEPLSLGIVRGLQRTALSPKQREIALMLALGKTAEEVVTQLSIGTTTYKDHVRKIYEKMGVNQRADLIRQLTRPIAA
ncbi:MAG: helix-turn-helix transcriptional regulator [Burkholderiaceae bacterium]